jgi:glyoxylase-like metal-dependent hydrolase (beta-lactamase superfamily II)
MKNGYIAGCSQSRQVVYIDPGDEAAQLADWIEKNDLILTAILNTHGHLDHVCGNRLVKERFDVPIYLHAADKILYDSLAEQATWFGLNYEPAPEVDRYLEDHSELKVGNISIRIHHTPGHSPGSVTLEMGSLLFCGDLIFAGGIGRTDLPGGSYTQLIESIKTRILPLGLEKILLSGHGTETTVGREARTNPFLTGDA